MSFLTFHESKLSNNFISNGYIISEVEEKKSLFFINKLITSNIKIILSIKKQINFNLLHKIVPIKDLNSFRLSLIYNLNKDPEFRFHYFNLARKSIYVLAGNELMMQKNINLSIQYPDDDSSLLPVHSDVWSGDSAYEINLWLPLVRCYKSKSMYILQPKFNKNFEKEMLKKKYLSSKKIYKLIKNKVTWIDIKYGQYLLFNQALPHGNIVNVEQQTRISMNCRFKSLYSPYGDKKIGEFFLPITTRAISRIGQNFKYPFKI
jgi:sporadic carbohydrate cluster 2OG-Fe(II) oxygenase